MHLFQLIVLIAAFGTTAIADHCEIGEGCVLLDETQCASSNECFWTTRGCQLRCVPFDQTTCNDCSDQCRWSEVANICARIWDIHFDVCFVVDRSGSILEDEWAAFRTGFVKSFIDVLTPENCTELEIGSDPEEGHDCPHVGLVLFDSVSSTFWPDLPSIDPKYQPGEHCLGPDVYLDHLPGNWESSIDNLPLFGANGGLGRTATVLGVQRCTDILVNSRAVDPKSFSLLVLMTDGNPNDPKCNGTTCSVCDVNPLKLADQLGGTNPNCAGLQTEKTQAQKIIENDIKTFLVRVKSDDLLFQPSDRLTCLLGLTEPYNESISLTKDDLDQFNATATRNELNIKAGDFANQICDFVTRPPTMSPTPSPTRGRECIPDDPPDRSCRYRCPAGSKPEWELRLEEHEYDSGNDVTIFKYCVETHYDYLDLYGPNACYDPRKKKHHARGVSHITIRLDECCDLCLKDEHFKDTSPRWPKISNNGAPFFKIDAASGVNKCYEVALRGEIGTQTGKYCVKGSTKCFCDTIEVPLSCDLKRVLDPGECESHSESDASSFRIAKSKKSSDSSRINSRARGHRKRRKWGH